MAPNKDKIRANAQKYLQKGQVEKAIREFQRLVAEDAKDVRTLLKIGDLQTRIGKEDEAATTYDQVANFYSEQGFFLKAVAVYKQILKLKPDQLETNLKLAELYQELGLTSDATNQFHQLAALYEGEGRLDEALGVVQRMLESDPDNIGVRMRLADIEAQQGKMGDARRNFESVANALKEQHRIDDYINVGERILHYFPDDLEATRELANIYIQKGDARRALAKLQICFKANPKDLPTLELLANAFRELGQNPKAVAVYKELGTLHREQNNEGAFIEVMERAKELAPDDKDILAALSKKEESSDATLGRIKPARKQVATKVIQEAGTPPTPSPSQQVSPQRVVAKPKSAGSPDEQAILRILTEADVYAKYGLKKKALDHIKKVFDLDPDHAEARAKYREMVVEAGESENVLQELWESALAAQKDGNLVKVRDLCEEILVLQPDHVQASKVLEAIDADDTIVPDTEVTPDRPVPTEQFEGLSEKLPKSVATTSADDFDLDADETEEAEIEVEASADIELGPDFDALEAATDDDAIDGIAGLEDVDASDDEIPEGELFEEEEHDSVRRAGDSARKALDEELAALLSSAVPTRKSPSPATDENTEPEIQRPVRDKTATEEYAVPDQAAQIDAEFADDDEEDDLGDELEEIDFFLQQGLNDEAREMLDSLLSFYPDHPQLMELQKRVEAVDDDEQDAAFEAPALDSDGFDLAAELADELQDVSQEELDVSFNDMFDDFKKGVAEQVEESDYDTHYNLGIAYKEMGLFDDSIREFELAQHAPELRLAATTMIGEAHREVGNFERALEIYASCLQHPDVSEAEKTSLHYELGQTHLAMGQSSEARQKFLEVQQRDSGFRDVGEKLAGLPDDDSEPPPSSQGHKISYL